MSMNVLLIAPTNSMVIKRGALREDVRNQPLRDLSKIPPQRFGKLIDYLMEFAGTPRYSYNAGLLSLAAWLRQNVSSEIKVQYLDLFGEAVMGKQRVLCWPEHEYPGGDLLVVHGLTRRGLHRRLSELQPDVVGVNCFTTAHHCDTVRVCEEVRKWSTRAHREVTIVVGGIHPTALDSYFARLPSVDFVVRGEGEATFAELLEFLRDGRDPSEVPGLTYASQHTGELVRTGNRSPIDIRELPWIARDLAPLKRGNSALNTYDLWHQGAEGEHLDVIARSRGCPYAGRGCDNCASARLFKPFRSRDVTDCLEEVEYLVERGVRIISDEADQVLWPPLEFNSFCQGLIERGVNERVRFITPNGLHIGLLQELGEQGRRLMINAGYTDLCLSLEGSQDYLDSVLHKPICAKDVVPVCESFRRIAAELNKRVIIRVFVMVDGPGATEGMAQRTYAFCERLVARRLVDHVIPFIATPVAGSVFFDKAMDTFVGRILRDFSTIYLPQLIPPGVLDHRREEIIHRLAASDRTVLYDIFHEFRVWPAFRYGLGRVQCMIGMDSELLESWARNFHELTGEQQFRIG